MSTTPKQGLRRELRFSEAIALSLAIMAPTAAMALNGTAVAGLIGRAVPLAFLIATIGVLFVSYGFVRLTRHFNSAGSVFALAGATLGPRAGFFAGFALMATYTLFTVASAAEVGLFGQSFLDGLGAGSVDWLIIALVAMVFVAILAFGDIRVADSLEYPYTVFPLVVAGWLALGLAIAVFVPGLARRVGEGLAREEGLAVPGAEERRD
jgi:amino acid transporter